MFMHVYDVYVCRILRKSIRVILYYLTIIVIEVFYINNFYLNTIILLECNSLTGVRRTQEIRYKIPNTTDSTSNS